jgi:hypothetical protein
MPPLFILCLILIGLVAFPDSGKASGSRPEKKVEWQETDLIQGYALLYGIADKQFPRLEADCRRRKPPPVKKLRSPKPNNFWVDPDGTLT